MEHSFLEPSLGGRRCVHSRMIQNHFLISPDVHSLYKGNIFLKQHVKKCNKCSQEVKNGVLFWEQKESIIESRCMSPSQRELFLSEVTQLIYDFEQTMFATDDRTWNEQIREYFYKFSLEVLSPAMLWLYGVATFSMILLYLV